MGTKTLHQAAIAGYLPEIRKLLDKGTPVDERDENQFTPLMYAAMQGEIKVVRPLLDAGADPHAAVPGARNVLGLAIGRGKPEVVRELLERGADVNVADDYHPFIRPLFSTPLMDAVQVRSPGVLEALIAAGANVNAAKADGTTALDLAQKLGNKRILKALAAAGARAGAPRAPDATEDIFEASRVGDVDAIKALLGQGLPPDARDPTGRTALSYAAQHGHLAAFNVLRAAGANPRAGATQASGKDVLESAVAGENDEIVEILLREGYPPDGVDTTRGMSFTPLMAAAARGNVAIAEMLIAAGANVNEKYMTETALKIAKRQGHGEVVELLKNAGAVGRDPAYVVARGFGKASEAVHIQDWLEQLKELCGAEPKPWKRRKGVYQVSVRTHDRLAEHFGFDADHVSKAKPKQRRERKEELFTHLREATKAKGCLLVRGDVGQPSWFRLFPTTDKFAVLAACGTNGVNYGLQTSDVIRWLRDLEATHPFELTACGHDFLAGEFDSPLSEDAALAKRMVEFCPDLLDSDEIDSPDTLAKQLSGEQELYFWWD